MQDGQNLFDAATSFAGIEWRMDETAQKLISRKDDPADDHRRHLQRLKQRHRRVHATEHGRGEIRKRSAMLYAKFVVDEVKPFIDRTYRTEPDKRTRQSAADRWAGSSRSTSRSNRRKLFGQIRALFAVAAHRREEADRIGSG